MMIIIIIVIGGISSSLIHYDSWDLTEKWNIAFQRTGHTYL